MSSLPCKLDEILLLLSACVGKYNTMQCQNHTHREIFFFFIYFLEGSVCICNGELELFICCKMTVPRLDLSVAAGNLAGSCGACCCAWLCLASSAQLGTFPWCGTQDSSEQHIWRRSFVLKLCEI